MSTRPGIEVNDESRGHTTQDVLESNSPAMSAQIVQLPSPVLIVSAYREHRAFLSDLLAGDGYHVSEAESAIEALEKIKTQKFELVVTGIQMRYMDGLELMRAVRDTNPNLPLIAIGDANPEMNAVYRHCAELLGVFETYSFPPDTDRFLDGARRAMRPRPISP